MNSNTRKELIKFIEAIEVLTTATVLTIGIQTASEILSQCYRLKEALTADETITESR